MNRHCVRLFVVYLICAAAVSTTADPAWSAPNKCTGKDGKVTYTEQACPQNQTQAVVKIMAAPSSDGPASGQRTTRGSSPRHEAQCAQARDVLESLKKEIEDEKHKDQADLVASARQEIAKAEQLIREQCG